MAVVADMIEGSVVANKLVSPRADRLRTELWEAVSPILGAAGVPSQVASRQVA
jgi:hypothetical protein